ncbi:phospho-acceptor domain-containing protein [Breznakibacter xylanolyticus]|uniref:histidine kinase n=1 Tax=Breznakibacter xylanolyticus TaxID=990 RepID=A0A2W7NVE8_9BACT|nr:HAMP domain-containing sensor histidine kinase [Breznakibacter xylanolyticus]PZX17286.1 phospho-acceptor domain-containing protein [Breznakibacter xylanolyticus]
MTEIHIPDCLHTTAQVYDHISDTIRAFIPKSIVIISQLDEKLNRSYVYNLTGLNMGLVNKLNAILGINPIGKTFHNVPDGDRFYFNLREFHKYNKSLYHFAGGQVPEWVCKSIETLFNIREIWCIGINHHNKPAGSVMVFTRHAVDNIHELEPYIHEASERIHRLIDQNHALLNIPSHPNEFTQAILRNISHEIRTPLNGILGMLEISDAYASADTEQRQELISSIWTNARTLTRTIENMVMASELETNAIRFNFAITTINQLIDRALTILNRIQRTVPNRNITLNIAHEMPIAKSELYLDKIRIDYVIEELLLNALKFSDEEIRISFATENDILVVSVIDSGIGMTEPEKKLVLKHFSKIHQEDKIYRGIGLGLTNANDIINRHMGNIRIDSTPGSGTTVSFCLPLYRNVRQQLHLGDNLPLCN